MLVNCFKKIELLPIEFAVFLIVVVVAHDFLDTKSANLAAHKLTSHIASHGTEESRAFCEILISYINI